MYSYIKGELSEIVAENHIVVENGGIGYNIYIPGQVLSLLPGVGEEVKIYTYLCVREDAFILYGFLFPCNIRLLCCHCFRTISSALKM